MTIKAPYPFFGAKSAIASALWQCFGHVSAYVEPFCGSAAVLLACPYDLSVVTLNDIDGFIVNFHRTIAADPDAVARWIDYPVTELDLFARHCWLINQADDLVRRLQTDPEYYDARIAGWWCWGACAWIGAGWCAGTGPWNVEDGEIVNIRDAGNAGQGVNRQLPHLGNAGRGINRQLPHLCDAGQGVNRGVWATDGACDAMSAHLHNYMRQLRDALRRPRVTCGDWQRVVTPSVTTRHGTCAVLLDPPYGEGAMEYSGGGNADSQLAADVWAWAVAHGNDPLLRIAVCAYDDGRIVPPGWDVLRWKAPAGYQQTDSAQQNPAREIVYLSPHCLHPIRNAFSQPRVAAESDWTDTLFAE